MVNNHWPRTGVTVPQVKGMYSKMRSSEMNGKQSATPQQSNGQKTEA
jgi:chromodomain-helicase-DNA-binding protein 1